MIVNFSPSFCPLSWWSSLDGHHYSFYPQLIWSELLLYFLSLVMPSVTLDLFPAKFEIFISFSHLLFLTLFPRLCKNMICYPLTPREVVHGHYSSLQLLCGRGFMLVLVRTFYALFVFSLSNYVAGLEACNNGQGQLEFEIEYKANFSFHFVSLKVLEIKDSNNITPTSSSAYVALSSVMVGCD